MLIPILGQPKIDTSTLTLIEKPAIVEQVKEPTLEEKIKTNFYKCNTDIQWIRADNAQCLDKQEVVQVTTQSEKPVRTPQNGSVGLNGYELGQCTGWVASQR